MKVVLVGASAFGLKCAECIASMSSCKLAGIISAPRKFRISYAPNGVENVLHADFASFAERHSVPLVLMRDRMTEPEIVDALELWQPAILVVAGWYHMVPRTLREKWPAYGLHASLLPNYSGGAPLVWAMINGERHTGITLFQLGDGIDNGPILGQAVTDILAEDTIASLYSRIETLGVELLRSHLPELSSGSARLIPQDESCRRVYPQRKPTDGSIVWHWPSHRIHNFIRAQTRPYPGAFFSTGVSEEILHVWESRLALPSEQSLGRSPGSVIAESYDGGIVVESADQPIVLLAIETCSGGQWWHDAGRPPILNTGKIEGEQ